VERRLATTSTTTTTGDGAIAEDLAAFVERPGEALRETTEPNATEPRESTGFYSD